MATLYCRETLYANFCVTSVMNNKLFLTCRMVHPGHGDVPSDHLRLLVISGHPKRHVLTVVQSGINKIEVICLTMS